MAKMDGYASGLLEIIGYRMKQLREHFNIKIERLCEVLGGISRVQYHKYEKGETNLSAVNLKRLADFYKVSLAYLTNERSKSLSDTVFFHLQTIDEIGTLKDSSDKHYISEEYSSLSLVKDKDKYFVFEGIQGTPSVSGIYKFEIKDGENYYQYMAKVMFPSPTNERDTEVLVCFKEDEPTRVKIDSIFFLARLVGFYTDIINDRFIKK